jgi:hypothetical protein
VEKITFDALLRSVSEQPIAAAAAKAAVIPGTTSKGTPASAQGGHLFGGAAEDERVAALEANHAAICAGVFDHQRVDFFLRDGLACRSACPR